MAISENKKAMMFYLNRNLAEQLAQAAKKEERSMTTVVTRALKQYLKSA